MTSTEVVSSGAGVFCSRAGERGLHGGFLSQGVPRGAQRRDQELAALMRVAYCPGMCKARSGGGQSLFPKQAAQVSPVARSSVARAGRQVVVWLLAQQGVQGG